MRLPFACVLPVLLLAACDSQEAEEPAPVAAPVAEPAEPRLSPPDEAVFSAAYAQACPDAPKVSTALCKSLGLGEEGFTCDYGLGKDEYRRNTATLVPEEGMWTLADPENTCATDAAQ